jgi:hypothetical protein
MKINQKRNQNRLARRHKHTASLAEAKSHARASRAGHKVSQKDKSLRVRGMLGVDAKRPASSVRRGHSSRARAQDIQTKQMQHFIENFFLLILFLFI